MYNVLDSISEVPEYSLQLVRIRPGAKDPILRAPQLRSGNCFHGLSKLLRILDGPDAPPDV
jgi:hypothetical protein